MGTGTEKKKGKEKNKRPLPRLERCANSTAADISKVRGMLRFGMRKTFLLDIFSGYGVDVEWWARCGVETDAESRETIVSGSVGRRKWGYFFISFDRCRGRAREDGMTVVDRTMHSTDSITRACQILPCPTNWNQAGKYGPVFVF